MGDPRATATRILEQLPKGDRDPTFRCHVCQDTGWSFFLPDSQVVSEDGRKYRVPEGGPGVVSVCAGWQGPCRYREWRRERAAERASRSGKPASGEGAAL